MQYPGTTGPYKSEDISEDIFTNSEDIRVKSSPSLCLVVRIDRTKYANTLLHLRNTGEGLIQCNTVIILSIIVKTFLG